MNDRRMRSLADGRALESLKAVAFDLSPEPAMVVDDEGALVAVNEAAEALFGHGLGLLARGRFASALPPGSALAELLERARIEVLDVSLPHAIRAGMLTGLHRDPFDRLLIAQSQIEDVPVVTADPVFAEHGVDVIW